MTYPSRPTVSDFDPDPPRPLLRRLAEEALSEDLGAGDVTTDLLLSPDVKASARIVAREPGVLAGLPIVLEVFRCADPDLNVEVQSTDGDAVSAGTVVCHIAGRGRPLLRAERTALNFLQRLSGIATLTARFVEAVQDTGARIVDTRKTTPGLRVLEKYAVRCGGGRNHRFGLSDGFLLKDNHRAILGSGTRGVVDAVSEARRRLPHTVPVEVEVDAPDQLAETLEAGVDAVLLDNFSLDELRRAVEVAGGKVLLEASGGITLATVRDVAATGVDLISVGALTHSAPALDLALDLEDSSTPSPSRG